MSRAGVQGKSKKSRKQGRRRPTQETIKKRQRKYRAAQKALRLSEISEGLCKATKPAIPNRVSAHESPEEERAERERTTAEYIDAIRPQLPALLKTLGEIEDPRDPKKVEHQLAMVLFHGFLCFILQMSSRREANQELTGPVLMEHLREYFPELDKLPHQDTVNRILSSIDVEKIQDAHMKMIRRLIRNKKFERFLINGRYPIAVDGTQKLVSRELLSPEWLERTIHKGLETERKQYYVYVLEASLAFANGLTLPLFTEFLDYTKGDRDNDKQDCETRAFQRLAKRLKTEFPRLPIMVLLDGLYPNGPIFETCRKNKWQFMIVLKDDSLPTLWAEFEGLCKLEAENEMTREWRGRRQHFQWVNEIEYSYGDNQKKRQTVHMVVCAEKWVEIDPETSKPVDKTSRHVWVSSEPLNKGNLHERCNLFARHRWNIEEEFRVEKRQGYQYEHCFSKNWKAMKGYHYLMHIACALNTLAQYAESLFDAVKQKGVRGFIKFIRDSLIHPWLAPASVKERLAKKPQLRLA